MNIIFYIFSKELFKGRHTNLNMGHFVRECLCFLRSHCSDVNYRGSVWDGRSSHENLLK